MPEGCVVGAGLATVGCHPTGIGCHWVHASPILLDDRGVRYGAYIFLIALLLAGVK